MKKIIKLLSFFFVAFLTLTVVNAAQIKSVTISNGDIAIIQSQGSVAGYYVGPTPNFSANTTKFYATTANTYYVSVKNGLNYFWVQSNDTTSGGLGAQMYGSAINVSTSCSNESKLYQTGNFDVQRCFVIENGQAKPDEAANIASCANGYKVAYAVKSNGCNNKGMTINGQNLVRRYCPVTYAVTCTPDGSGGGSGGGGGGGGSYTPAASVSSLSVSSGSLNPGFSAGNKNYTVNVPADVTAITINATASGGGFVDGYGPRTEQLGYGSNKFYVTVANAAGQTTTYTIDVIRADNRNGDNSLKSLSIDKGTISPAFTSDNTSYTAQVAAGVTSLKVEAEVNNPLSTFVDGFGPRTVTIDQEQQQIEVRVISQNGQTRSYFINVSKSPYSEACAQNENKFGLLKKINIISGSKDDEIEQPVIEEGQLNYEVQIPYNVKSVEIEALADTDGDTVTIDHKTLVELEVNKAETVKIDVTSLECGVTHTYTLKVTRQSEKVESSDADVEDIKVKGYKIFGRDDNKEGFTSSTMNYVVKIKPTNSTAEDLIEVITKNEKAVVEIEDKSKDKKLKSDRTVTIIVKSEDGKNQRQYSIKFQVKKGANIFVVILIVIIIIIILILLVMRLLGYKIVINSEVIGAWFRGLGGKVKDKFDK
jgi:hypothetical protein